MKTKTKTHSLSVPDYVWEAYGRSPMAMRDVLIQNMLRVTHSDNGTRIEARYHTTCPICGKSITPGSPALMMEINGHSRAVHESCGVEHGQ